MQNAGPYFIIKNIHIMKSNAHAHSHAAISETKFVPPIMILIMIRS